MRKPYKEGKPGLKIELNKVGILLIAFLLSKNLFPQIPINGFCKYNVFDVEKGYSGLLTFNFNRDSYTDLVLINPAEMSVLVMEGQKNGAFGLPQKFNIPLNISKTIPIFDKTDRQKEFAFTDRRDMVAGIYSFSQKGEPKLINYLKFNSYPGNMSTADINQDGREEILISGSAFNGLSILYKDKNKLLKRKIVQNRSYSDAVFADLTNDGYHDIAAFNIISDSLEFFYNDESGNFSRTRRINVGERISSLQALDLNLDSYQDLMYVHGDSISILYGDFTSSYDTSVTITTLYHPDKIITGDFNRDGKIDIAYINFKNSTLSVIYAKNSHSFYPEIIYTRQDGIKDIVPFYSKFINGLAAITNKGKLFTIARMSPLFDNVNITAGAQPRAISYFDSDNNGIKDICYIDNFRTTLNCLVRDAAGIPKFYYSYKLFKSHSEILVDDNFPSIKSFYCYSPGKKLIEVVKINFATGTAEKKQLYSPGLIQELKLSSDKNNNTKIYSVYTKQNELGLNVFSYNDVRYNSSNYSDISGNVLSSSIILHRNPGVSYWKFSGNTLFLSQSLIDLNLKTIKTSIPVVSKDSITIVSYSADLLNDGSDATISFIKTLKKEFAVFSSSRRTSIIKGKKYPANLTISADSKFYFGDINSGGPGRLFVYTPQSGKLYKIEFLQQGREIMVTNKAIIKNVYSYFIKNMSFKSYHIVYTDSSAGSITLRQLQ